MAGALNSLSSACLQLGDYRRARALLQRALAIQQAHYGDHHIELAATLGNLGTAHGALGGIHQARQLLERALVIQERHYGSEHVEVAMMLNQLGRVCGALGDHAKALAVLQRALRTMEAQYGQYHSHVAMVLSSLSDEHAAIGDAVKAAELRSQARSQGEVGPQDSSESAEEVYRQLRLRPLRKCDGRIEGYSLLDTEAGLRLCIAVALGSGETFSKDDEQAVRRRLAKTFRAHQSLFVFEVESSERQMMLEMLCSSAAVAPPAALAPDCEGFTCHVSVFFAVDPQAPPPLPSSARPQLRLLSGFHSLVHCQHQAVRPPAAANAPVVNALLASLCGQCRRVWTQAGEAGVRVCAPCDQMSHALRAVQTIAGGCFGENDVGFVDAAFTRPIAVDRMANAAAWSLQPFWRGTASDLERAIRLHVPNGAQACYLVTRGPDSRPERLAMQILRKVDSFMPALLRPPDDMNFDEFRSVLRLRPLTAASSTQLGDCGALLVTRVFIAGRPQWLPLGLHFLRTIAPKFYAADSTQQPSATSATTRVYYHRAHAVSMVAVLKYLRTVRPGTPEEPLFRFFHPALAAGDVDTPTVPVDDQIIVSTPYRDSAGKEHEGPVAAVYRSRFWPAFQEEGIIRL